MRVFYELPAEEAGALGDSVEQQLGVALMSFMVATYTSDVFGLGRYRRAAKNMEKERSQVLRSKSASGNISSMYEWAMHAIALGLRAKSKAKMAKADQLLREAAVAGSVEAADYLADLWPALKERSDRTFK